jgi:hypothetical protein
MRRVKRFQVKKKATLRWTAFLVLFSLFTYFLVSGFADRGIAQKWATATLATLMIFAAVIYFARPRVGRWTFWTALSICFLGHAFLVWFVFDRILKRTTRFSILFWYPVILVEVVMLLIFENRIEKLLSQNPGQTGARTGRLPDA